VEQLRYIGSVVLGLNDALVELTGILAGFTLALQNTRVIAVAGLITGIAAALSMAASVYLSTESEKSLLSPGRSAFYTGFAYLATVLFLVYPYLIFRNPFAGLALTILDAVLVITVFTYYSSVAQDTSFTGRFRKMAFVSLGVAALTFGIGFAVRKVFNISI
jgi:VIT1/CCC1 family predicted Fe2+/Mn2+ transporter